MITQETEQAATPRSILACPAAVSLVVEGVDDVLGDVTEVGGAGMRDVGGVPTFSIPTGARLARAASKRRRALLTIESGLGSRAAAEREVVLTLGGRLETQGSDSCECCPETRDRLTLHLDLVLLNRTRVPIDRFRSAEHLLNRGYLQRTVEHANACHHEELRRAVSTATETRLGSIIGASLTDLSPTGVGVRWLDAAGSHAYRLDFPRPAVTPDDLGDLLRSQLHAGLC